MYLAFTLVLGFEFESSSLPAHTHTLNHLSWKIEGFEVLGNSKCPKCPHVWQWRFFLEAETNKPHGCGQRHTRECHGKGKPMNKEEQTDGFMVVQTEGPPHTQLKAIFLCQCHILWAASRLILPELSQASVKLLREINTLAWQDGLSKAEMALTTEERMPWLPWWDYSVQHEGGRKGSKRRRDEEMEHRAFNLPAFWFSNHVSIN